jgi:hypothetical protein
MEKTLPKIVEVDLSEIIDTDLEGFLDILSERATGSPLLMDISYRIVSVENDTLKIEVDGDTSAIEEL